MNQVARTLGGFMARLAGVLAHRGRTSAPAPPPVVDAVLRLGYAGHLEIDGLPHLATSVHAVLAQVAAAARERSPGLRLQAVGQLAQGADTLVAQQALALGYELHAILPGPRASVVRDLHGAARSASDGPAKADDVAARWEAEFSALLGRSTRVLELDASADGSGQELQSPDYEQCAEVMLSRVDCLIALDHSAAGLAAGGTRWTERRARAFGIPVIRIPIDRPGIVVLMSDEDGEDQEIDFAADEGRAWADAVARRVARIVAPLAVPAFPFPTGAFERRFMAQLDIDQNRAYWDGRWRGPQVQVSSGLSDMRAFIDDSIGRWAVWADHRASAMAELVRGAFVFCALLGLLAVSCALVGLVCPAASTAAKLVEAACLLGVVWFIARDRKMHWRDQWLFCRQLERRLDHAAWLLLLGRELKHELPAEIREFHGSPSAAWMSALGRAVVRAAGLPQLSLDRAYLQTVRELVLERLIRSQAIYCSAEVASQRAADHLLERWIRRTFFIALLVTGAYLALKVGVKPALHAFAHDAYVRWFEGDAAPIWERLSIAVSIVGIGMPGIAAALASIRSHGDFAQLATRYAGVGMSLREAEALLERLCPSDGAACASRNMAAVIHHVVSLLGHEATSWSAIVQTKEIEAS